MAGLMSKTNNVSCIANGANMAAEQTEKYFFLSSINTINHFYETYTQSA